MQGKPTSQPMKPPSHSPIHNHLLVRFFDFAAPLVTLLVLAAVALERVDT